MEQLSDDPEGAFVPPEFDITGNTYEAHVYSLGATLKAAIDFVIEPEVEPEFCQDLKTLLEQMQQENPADRPDIESIISLCELKMNCSTSCSICRNLSAVGRRVLSIESVNSFQDGYKNTWKIKHQTDTEVKLQRKDVAESVLSAAEDYASKSYLNGCVNNMPLDDGDCEYGLNEIAIKMDRERNHEHSKYRNHYKELEMKSFSEKYDSILETEQCDDDFGRLILKKSLISKPQSFPKDPVQYSEKRNILTSESDNGMFTKKSWSSASELLSLNNIKDVGFCNICLQIKSQPKCCQVSCLNSEVTDSHECTQLSNIFKEKYPSVLKEKAEFSLGCCTNEFCLVSAETPIVEAACEVPGHLIAGREVLGKDSSTSEDHAQTSILLNANFLSQINCKSLLLKDDTKEKECKAHQINSLHSSMLHRSDDKENFDGDRQSEIINDEPQWISLKDLLSWYGRPLKEYELWALCHECLCSLQTYINYPAYLSLDTVMIDSHGEVLFSVPEDADCYDAFSMAPEFEEQGLVTEKVCVYGVAAILWTAAKYNFSPNRKLSLPKKLKKLLLNMAKRNANDRLSLTDALKICQEYLFQQGINSKTVWSQLSRCAYQQNEEAILGDCVSLVPADKHDKEGSLESIVGFVPVTNKSKLTAVRGPVPYQFSMSNEASKLPITFTSPATYFKPIILMQNTDLTRNKHEIYRTSCPEQLVEVVNNEIIVDNTESICVNDIESHAVEKHSASVYQLTPGCEKKTASPMTNSNYSSLKGQSPNNLLSFTAHSTSTSNSLSDHKEIISRAASSSSSVCSTIPSMSILNNVLLKQDPEMSVPNLESLQPIAQEQVPNIHYQTETVCDCLSNPPEFISDSLGINNSDNSFENSSPCNQETWSTSNKPARKNKVITNINASQNESLNSYSSFDATNNIIKMNSKEVEECEEKLDTTVSFPDNSSSMDADTKCLSNLKYSFQQKITICSSLQKVVHLIQEEFAFDGYLENGVEELAMGEYIFALKGLQFGTFVGAISEKFCDLYWNETFLENLYTAVNGKTPSLLRIAKGVSTMSSTSQNSKRNSTSPAKKKTKTKKVEKQSNHAQLSLVHHEESVCITFPLLDVPFQTDGSQETVTLNAGKETQVASESAISSTVDLCFDGIDFKEFLPDNIEKEYRPLHPLLGTEIKEHPIESNFLQDDTFSLNPDFKDMDGQNAEDMLIRTIKTLGVMPACTADTYRCNPGWSSAFYGAGCFHPDVQSYVKKLGMQKKNEIPSIEAKKLELQQQLMIETKNYRKTIKFYQKLMQKEKVNKDSEIRTMLAKLKGQLEEMKSKVQFLELVKKYLQVTYAELWGLEQCAVPTVVNITQCEMEYRHPEETSLLIFYSEKEHKGDRYNKSKILQAGTPLGLMAYLYTRNAVLEGYVQQFLYTFRYFCTRQDFLQFLIGRANCALSRENLDSSSTLAKIYNRTLYLLQAWIEDCYIVDFSTNTDLLDNLEDFIYSRLIPMDSRGEQLLSLLKDITRKKDECTSPCLSFVQQKDEDTKSLHSLCTKFSEDNISRKSLNWKFSKGNESILLHQKEKQYTIASALPRPCYPNFMEEFSSSYMKVDERGSYFISEYSVQQLSSQLTLLQEKMFQKCHPVHFLNSRVLGVKDRVTIATKTVTTRAFPAEASSLFVQNCIQDNYLLQLLRYGDNISTWVAAEIVTCHTSKLQANFLSKFLLIAKSCYEQRDFATAMQILGGLENLMVRQLPVWKNLPSKISKILEELKAIKVFLKSDSLCLMEGDKFKTLPTIPSAHLLAMHVQQLETGGFTNVNGTFKWTKLRHIAKVVSQVHAFQEIPYTLTPDPELQYHLRQRFAYFSGADISVLAADNNTNFYQIPAGKYCRRIQDTLCRMKATFQ
ncbi:kinase non-catalytic C-lobe domain-containing protein 1 isoform X3 [Rhinatrema bivittatum]|nr:kinase non-catalytic C-lobe domain-containing protein 1 isoform X3 [Rhinatrema bivittatum]